MIIFDYGHTLVYEEKWDGVKAQRALMEHCISNKNNLTAEQISEFASYLFESAGPARKTGVDFHEHMFSRLLNEYLQLEINLSPFEEEKLYWDTASPARAMPHIKETLGYLRENNIRSGVISNISFSGEALKSRINEVLPENNFEFIIASSEYIFRKPGKIIFGLALNKAGLDASEVWYCGDSPEFDVAGAGSAGIFPVWYESEIECWYRERGDLAAPACAHLRITDWRELIKILENLE